MGCFPLARLAAGAALVLSCLTVAPSAAWADEASAETLFQEGLAAMKRNDYAVACEAFAQSNKADPSPGTQINLAVCYEKQKKWASAWTWYRSAVGLAQQRNQGEREKLAQEAAARLKPQLSYIIVSVKEPLTDLVVRRDGAEVTIALGGKEVPLPVDPGEHSIEVSARGKKPWSTTIQVADNAATDRVEVPKLEDAPVEDKQVTPGDGTTYQPPVVVTSDGSAQRTVGIVVAGAGVLAGLAGAGVFILAKSEESERDKQRSAANALVDPNTNQPTDVGRYDALNRSADSHGKAAKNNQLIAAILGGGAVVLVGVGAVLYFTAPRGEKSSAGNGSKPMLLPLVSPGFAGLGLGGTF
ncbi:MAG: hypothetical protein KIS78_34820 [Labilithrix sp.]|nr:hypothetical protein [Labilithrix sp.]MCW5837618.1 hypothetical protein [Labilithrix sp.]